MATNSRSEDEIRQSIASSLNVLALHAGDAQDNAAYTQRLIAQATMSTAEEVTVAEHTSSALHHINSAITALNATKTVLHSSGAS